MIAALRCTDEPDAAVEVREALACVAACCELAPHPATTQTTSNSNSALGPPFMGRMTQQPADPFPPPAVTFLTNRWANPAVRWVKASYRGFPTMINVVCYCGCAYSFAGDVGRCPQCGEHVSFSRRPGADPVDKQETIAKIVARLSAEAGSAPGELAA
jgi:hypothetical protein